MALLKAIADLSGRISALAKTIATDQIAQDIANNAKFATKEEVNTGLNGKQPVGDYATNSALSSGLSTKVDVSAYEAKIQQLEARIASLEQAGYITSADLPTTADFVE